MESLNIKLRSMILERSLQLENLVNSLLGAMFRIPKQSSLTLGSKSTSLSFKNKIDLLQDLGRLDKDEHQQLLMFTEIRNQFVHNVDANTFEGVLSRLKDKKQKFLKFKETDLDDKEAEYAMCFDNLHIKSSELLLTKFKQTINEWEQEKANEEKLIEHRIEDMMVKCLTESIDITFKQMDKVFAPHFGGDFKVGSKFKQALHNKFEELVNERKNSLND